MRKLCIPALVLLALVAQAVDADTIHLKNGSVLKGKVASFADDQFVLMIDTGSGRYLSRAMVYIGDVARIEFDGAPSASAEPAPHDTSPPRETTSSVRPNESAGVTVSTDIPRSSSSGESSRTAQPAETQPRELASQPRETAPVESQPTKEPESSTSAPETSESERAASERSTRKSAGPVRTATIDVVGKRDWTSTGLIVKRGDRIRIAASGLVTVDPANGRTSGPEGINDLIDPKKLMIEKPTGALIGVISSDNDDFIFIGRSTEFTATRDGLLFLSVNEGLLSDNTGIYKAVIEVQSQKK